MTQRQIVLDTETTGLRWKDDHRIIEIGCIEIQKRRLTTHHFHHYFQPERAIDAGAQKVHGITAEFLADKPLIGEQLDAFIEFINGAELIIHNAPFDVGFLDYELARATKSYKKIADYCTITDTLVLARNKHSGRRNTLDALCQRYEVDASDRQLHGALLDARLLAEVYLKMSAGQKNLFADDEAIEQKPTHDNEAIDKKIKNSQPLKVIYADEQEKDRHQRFIKKIAEKADCLWIGEK